MAIRVAINGFGRIGRNIVRALYEYNRREDIQVVAINDLSSPDMSAHLLKFDSIHGTFTADMSYDNGVLNVNGDRIEMLAIANPRELPWARLDVDVVFECTGRFKSREALSSHVEAGAKKVLLSCPGSDLDATVVHGVNHDIIKPEHVFVSNASCTTNCLAPVVKPIHEHFGIVNGLMTTIHAVTNDQHLLDLAHSDPYRARAATQSMIPTKTGAAAAVGQVLPELKGKLDGLAVRVPTPNVSMVDLVVQLEREVTVDEVNDLLRRYSETELKGVLAVNSLPLVSIDFNHNPASSVFDTNHTRVIGRQLKVMSWYDNEWGFSNRMLDNCVVMMNA